MELPAVMETTPRTAAIIEARMTSTRLPGKILLPVMDRPLLELLIERLRRASTLDTIVVATTVNQTDDVVEDLARSLGVACFRGSEEDVLGRVLGAAGSVSAATIVEVTGDCPLIDPAIVDRVVDALRNSGSDYASNILQRTYPRGLDVQAFPTRVLKRVAELTDDPVDHEHVSLYIYEHPETFSLTSVESHLPSRFADLRLTVDTPDDLEVVRRIFQALYPVNNAFGFDHVAALADRNPEIFALNASVDQKPVR
jgi:spore coat polysaccharide biosynthesis protein SpsF